MTLKKTLLCFLAVLTAQAQPIEDVRVNPLLSGPEAVVDLAVALLERVHPGYSRYTDTAVLERHWATLSRRGMA